MLASSASKHKMLSKRTRGGRRWTYQRVVGIVRRSRDEQDAIGGQLLLTRGLQG